MNTVSRDRSRSNTAVKSGQLADLIARIEAADGPDRELDELIAMRVAGFKPTIRLGHEILGNLRDVPAHSPRYTASIDAVLALVERMLPGWEFSLSTAHQRKGWAVKTWMAGDKFSGQLFDAPTPALALILALLRALSSAKREVGEDSRDDQQ